jgi:hypothetical protein
MKKEKNQERVDAIEFLVKFPGLIHPSIDIGGLSPKAAFETPIASSVLTDYEYSGKLIIVVEVERFMDARFIEVAIDIAQHSIPLKNQITNLETNLASSTLNRVQIANKE